MSTSIEYTSKQGPVLEKTFEDANDQHISRIIGYVDDSADAAGVYADADLTKLIPADEAHRLCEIGRLFITPDGGESIHNVVTYTDSALAYLLIQESESESGSVSYIAVPVVVPFEAE